MAVDEVLETLTSLDAATIAAAVAAGAAVVEEDTQAQTLRFRLSSTGRRAAVDTVPDGSGLAVSGTVSGSAPTGMLSQPYVAAVGHASVTDALTAVIEDVLSEYAAKANALQSEDGWAGFGPTLPWLCLRAASRVRWREFTQTTVPAGEVTAPPLTKTASIWTTLGGEAVVIEASADLDEPDRRAHMATMLAGVLDGVTTAAMKVIRHVPAEPPRSRMSGGQPAGLTTGVGSDLGGAAMAVTTGLTFAPASVRGITRRARQAAGTIATPSSPGAKVSTDDVPALNT